ncbi:ureidoglycolate lyase [Microvirga sp. M2]|uniref:ureidoglycolate lyase n=1 Tax=Microvirga sp. M2 TaxID=3073270 RepID=UPI0039C442D3
MPTNVTVRSQVLDPTAVAPFGWMLGKPYPCEAAAAAYRNAMSAFWQEHLFDPGADGEVEVLWVTYRDSNQTVDRLEAHHRTQQAIVPLTGEIIQIVALSDEQGAPDLSTVRAFQLSPGIGICMRPGVWHSTRIVGAEAMCLMLTRRSTTRDLVDHLASGAPAKETSLRDVQQIQFIR